VIGGSIGVAIMFGAAAADGATDVAVVVTFFANKPQDDPATSAIARTKRVHKQINLRFIGTTFLKSLLE
jgi:hypothetical protein